jgi:hypothetical protein
MAGDRYSQSAVCIMDRQEGTLTATEPKNTNSSITNNQHRVAHAMPEIRTVTEVTGITNGDCICLVHQQ